MTETTTHGPIKRFLLLVRWRIRRLDRAQLRRWAYKLSRPASLPYLSGDGFRKLADHLDDAWWERIPARRVKAGDVLFVSTNHARRFFAAVDPRIDVPYVLITHNSDLAVDKTLVSAASANVMCWYAQNCTHADPRVVPIPIGLENLHHYHAGIPEHFEAHRMAAKRKQPRIVVGFSLGSNVPWRQEAQDIASRLSCADCLPARLAQPEYMQTLARYMFVLAPPGNGLDTHRAWEALYLGVVPIVKDSVAMRSFAELGVPLWIVRSWDELLGITEVELEAKYASLKGALSSPVLFMDYWQRRILECSAETRLRSAQSNSGALHLSAPKLRR
jgi:hypothetical protein